MLSNTGYKQEGKKKNEKWIELHQLPVGPYLSPAHLPLVPADAAC
jgi:hypothetical protein